MQFVITFAGEKFAKHQIISGQNIEKAKSKKSLNVFMMRLSKTRNTPARFAGV